MKKYNSIINEMLVNCVHLGHKKNLLNPLMREYTIKTDSQLSIINLEKTNTMFKKALNIIKELILLNKIFLIICTKKRSKKIIEFSARNINMPYVNNRWLGGTLTNFETLKKSINNISYLNNLIKNKKTLKIKKKTLNIYYKKIKKSKKFLKGVENLIKLPDFLFIIGINQNKIAILEAKKKGIPIIAIGDTDSSPKNIDLLIPGNDDSFKSISFYMKKITDTVNLAKKNLSKNE